MLKKHLLVILFILISKHTFPQNQYILFLETELPKIKGIHEANNIIQKSFMANIDSLNVGKLKNIELKEFLSDSFTPSNFFDHAYTYFITADPFSDSLYLYLCRFNPKQFSLIDIDTIIIQNITSINQSIVLDNIFRFTYNKAHKLTHKPEFERYKQNLEFLYKISPNITTKYDNWEFIHGKKTDLENTIDAITFFINEFNLATNKFRTASQLNNLSISRFYYISQDVKNFNIKYPGTYYMLDYCLNVRNLLSTKNYNPTNIVSICDSFINKTDQIITRKEVKLWNKNKYTYSDARTLLRKIAVLLTTNCLDLNKQLNSALANGNTDLAKTNFITQLNNDCISNPDSLRKIILAVEDSIYFKRKTEFKQLKKHVLLSYFEDDVNRLNLNDGITASVYFNEEKSQLNLDIVLGRSQEIDQIATINYFEPGMVASKKTNDHLVDVCQLFLKYANLYNIPINTQKTKIRIIGLADAIPFKGNLSMKEVRSDSIDFYDVNLEQYRTIKSLNLKLNDEKNKGLAFLRAYHVGEIFRNFGIEEVEFATHTFKDSKNGSERGVRINFKLFIE